MHKLILTAIFCACFSVISHAQQITAPPTSTGALYITGSAVGNGADLTQDTLQSYTLAAGKLQNVGDQILISAGGQFIGSTDNRTARILFGGTQVMGFTTTSASATRWGVQVLVTKTGSNTQSYMSFGAGNAGTTADSNTLTKTDTSTIVVSATGQNTTNSVANSIVCQYFTVSYIPAPPS
jgi:hypothetical protein